MTKFPSPIGELHFSIKTKYDKVGSRWFPSPIGELHFSIVRWFLTVNADSSFRPLSGSYISQWI